MRPESIVPYISLTHLIGIIEINAGDNYSCILKQEPTREGLEEIVGRRAIECLEKAGLKKDGFNKNVRKMIRSASITLPTIIDVYKTFTMQIPEQQFSSLASIGRVRQHFEFTFVTRRMMLPVGGNL